MDLVQAQKVNRVGVLLLHRSIFYKCEENREEGMKEKERGVGMLSTT